MKKITVLLAGANGQVGKAVQDVREQQIDKNKIYLIALGRDELNIADFAAVKNALAKYQPDWIINAAAYTAVDKAESEREQAMLVNAIGAENLARGCAEKSIPLLHLSTDYVFNGEGVQPYLPADKTAPLGVYGLSKWRGEEAIRQYHHQHIILRVSWVFGEHGHNFVKTMLRLMQEREELRVVSDQYGCPTYAGDIAEVMLKIIFHIGEEKTNAPWGTYHYCGLPAVSWFGFAEKIAEYAKNGAIQNIKIRSIRPVSTAEYPTPAPRPFYSVLDCADFVKTFGEAPRSWQTGLQKVIKFLHHVGYNA